MNNNSPRVMLLLAFIALSVCAFSSEPQNALNQTAADLAIFSQKKAIAAKVKDEVDLIVKNPKRFDLSIVFRNFNEGNDGQHRQGFEEFNFVISYKTEPLDRSEVRDELHAVLKTAFAVLEKEGFKPEENRIRIRCRTTYSEKLGGETIFFTFGKGHWSYNEYEDPIQFRERWNLFTDGE